jgi:hypothetical protein
MSKKPPTLKPCERCEKLVEIRYRIQIHKGCCWTLVCPDCQKRYSQNNPDYRYGGTWKAR